jgi:hypothetical protein
MEYDVHDCPACHIDHQAMTLVKGSLEDPDLYVFQCPETDTYVLVNVRTGEMIKAAN